MRIFEYVCKKGLHETEDFLFSDPATDGKNDDEVLEGLGYSNQHESIYSPSFFHWIEVYRHKGDGDYAYVVCMNNHFRGDYIVCRTYMDYLDFLKEYLPVIESLNRIGIATESKTDD